MDMATKKPEIAGRTEPQLLAPPERVKNDLGGKNLPPGSTKRGHPWIWILAFVILCGGALYFFWPKIANTVSPEKAADGSGRKNGDGQGPAPVVAARVRKGNIGVYFTGLGSVTPLNTVTVKSRVDGQLMKVAYKEGQLVHQGDTLVEIDPRPYQVALTQAQGQLAKDQAALDNARIDLNRYQTLYNEKVISEQQATTQKATVETDEGAVKADQGQVDAAKLNIVYTHITAPITGRVGLRLVDEGNMVHATDANGLVVITQMQPISAIFTIAEDQLQVVLKKMSAGETLIAEAWNRELTSKITQGTLTTLDNQIDPQTGTLKLRATFDNADNTLYPNQFVNVRLLVQQKNGVTLAPSAAIQRNTNNTYVYLVQPDSTVTIRNVTVGATEGDDSEITSGLTPGDVVVLTGVDKLQDGSKVTVQIPGENNSPDLGSKGQGKNPASKGGGRNKKGN